MRITIPHLIAAGLVILLVLVVSSFAMPAFDNLKDKMGFGTDLSAGETQAQIKAREIFVEYLYSTFNDCKDSKNVSCFCTDEEIAFPTDYTFNLFDNEDGEAGLILRNHLGGEVESRYIQGLIPCVGWIPGMDLSKLSVAKDRIILVKYGLEPRLEFYNLGEGNGVLVSEPVDPNYVFYKPKDGYICILAQNYASAKKVTSGGICE